MTCDQWNKAVAKINLLPKNQQAAKMDELYLKLVDNKQS